MDPQTVALDSIIHRLWALPHLLGSPSRALPHLLPIQPAWGKVFLARSPLTKQRSPTIGLGSRKTGLERPRVLWMGLYAMYFERLTSPSPQEEVHLSSLSCYQCFARYT